MQTPEHNTEPFCNSILGALLREVHPAWRQGRLRVEATRSIKGRHGQHPDILIHHELNIHVAVECEFDDENEKSVEQDACSRLGRNVASTGHPIHNVCMVRYPAHLRGVSQDDLKHLMGLEMYLFAFFSLDSNDQPQRFPVSGWLSGNVALLADTIEMSALSERLLEKSAARLETGISEAAGILSESQGEWQDRLAAELYQIRSKQTLLMACAIIANALIFHSHIEGQQGIKTLDELEDLETGVLTKKALRDCWHWVLENVNYWPIFDLARRLLAPVPNHLGQEVIKKLLKTSQSLHEMGSAIHHDITGRMFQGLIADRKFLATYYTLPTSASFLAEIAIDRLEVDWSQPDAISALRIADPACGTGTLLTAVYRAIRMRHRRTGGDDKELHTFMMERVFYAADIMPAATHLTAALLASVHPGTTFGNTQVITMPYGPIVSGTNNRELSLGALDLLVAEEGATLFSTGRTSLHGKNRNQRDEGMSIDIPHESMDLVIMNPPYTRLVGKEKSTTGDNPHAAFAGFKMKPEDQKAMVRKARRLRGQTKTKTGSDSAGLASYFMNLAHVKLRRGGVLAAVLPFTFTTGIAWDNTRAMLQTHFHDVLVVSLATDKKGQRAFSADTQMAECLVVATKRSTPVTEKEAHDTCFANLLMPLRALPAAHLLGKLGAKQFSTKGGQIRIGDSAAVKYLGAPLKRGNPAGIREPAIAECAINLLKHHRLCLPHATTDYPLSLTSLEHMGHTGLYHLQILLHSGNTGDAPFFRGNKLQKGEEVTYPALWNHDHKQETCLDVHPDYALEVRDNYQERAKEVWRTASRLHLSQEFRLNSQSLAVCLTPKKTIGGRAWPNFTPHKTEWNVPILLWSNCTLGLILWWWIGARQQPGRSNFSISTLPALPMLDCRMLTPRQILKCNDLYESLRYKSFKSAHQAFCDDTRQELDSKLLADVLGLPSAVLEPLGLLRSLWCAEPTVHGYKG